MARIFPPGPGRSHLLLGAMADFNHHRLQFMRDMMAYGEVALAYFGPYRVFFVNSPDTIHQVLVADAAKVAKSRVTTSILAPVLGTGLFTSNGELWKRQRRLTQPAFHTRRIGAYADTMVAYAAQLADGWRTGAEMPLDHQMTELTMRIIAKTMFDADVTAEAPQVGEAVFQVLSIAMDRFSKLYPVPTWLPIRSNVEMRRAIGRIDALIAGFIRERRASGEDKGDLLSMLLLAQDEEGGGGMSDKQVRDEAMTIFGAGHETTAVALTWAWILLAQHPQVEARLHDELDAVLGGRPPGLDDLPRLAYTEQIIRETMRLYPPAWGTTREVIEPFSLGGYTVRPPETIFVNIYGVHHDARYFEDPERFDPDRFAPEAEKALPRYAYLPFGGGPRICIGNAFAMMEAKLVLATLAQRFRLRLVPGQRVVPETVFTLRPDGGVRMVAEARVPVAEPALAPA